MFIWEGGAANPSKFDSSNINNRLKPPIVGHNQAKYPYNLRERENAAYGHHSALSYICDIQPKPVNRVKNFFFKGQKKIKIVKHNQKWSKQWSIRSKMVKHS